MGSLEDNQNQITEDRGSQQSKTIYQLTNNTHLNPNFS